MNHIKYNAALKSISKMDISMLDLILDKDQYSDVPKEIFIKGLSDVFTEFRYWGNTELSIQKGKCSKQECNLGKTGISCIGNISGHRLDLIVEGDLDDIYYCKSFSIEEGDQKGVKISLRFYDEDKVNYKPSPEYLIKIQKSERAQDELIQERLITGTVLRYWLKKHNEFFSSLDYKINSRLNSYFNFYHEMETILEYLESQPKVFPALDEYSQFDPDDEEHLLNWLIKWEDFSMDNFHDLHYLFPGHFQDGVIKYRDLDIYFTMDEFGPIFTFNDLFDNYYWDLREKYEKLTEQYNDEPKDYYGRDLKELVQAFKNINSIN